MVCLAFARQVIRSNLLSLVRSDPLDGMAVNLVMWQYLIMAMWQCGNFSLWQCRCIQGNSIGTICVLSRFWTPWWHIIVYHMAFLNLNVIPSTLTLDSGEGWHDISLPIKKTGSKVILEFLWREVWLCANSFFTLDPTKQRWVINYHYKDK